MINQEILNCQTLLHPDEPVEVTSQDVKPYLAQLGWQEGDKIPSGMQQYTSAVLKILGKAISIKNIGALFEDETVQLTLKSALNKTKLVINENEIVNNKVKELVPHPENLHANTVDTIIALAKKAAKEEIKKEAQMDANNDEDIDGLEELGDEDESDSESDVDDTEEVESKLVIPPHICPRCGIDILKPYDPYPITEDDKISYVYCVLGNNDFSKTYNVVNNTLHITYTVPTADVMRLIENQVKYDVLSGKIKTSEQNFITSYRYGLALSLKETWSSVGLDKIPPMPDLNDKQFNTPGETNIAKYTEYIEKNIIKSSIREPFFRSTYADFVKLQVFLQNKIKDENFIKAVLDKSY